MRGFKLHAVAVGLDENVNDITSCVVLPDDTDEEVRRTVMPRGENQWIAMEVVDALLHASQELGQGGAPAGQPCVRLEAAVNAVAERVDADAKHKKLRAKESVVALVDKRIYACEDGWLWRS